MATTVSKTYSTDEDYKDGSFKDLYWPDRVPEIYDMLRIDIVRFIPISQSGLFATSSIPQAQATPTASTSTSPTAVTPASTFATQLSNVQRTGGDRQALATILLPVPEGIQYADAPAWSEEDIGILGKFAPGLAAQAAGGDTAALGNTLSSLAKAGLGPMVLNKIKEAGGPSPESITQGVGGRVLNPYKEQIFKGIGMRTFSFRWKLVPRNSKEQVRIHNIIKALRYYALPDYTSSSGLAAGADDDAEGINIQNNLNDRWLTVPNIYNLKWLYGKDAPIQSLPKIKPAVLKNISVNYTPEGVWATHQVGEQALSGPAPIAYELNLEFQETEIITAKEVTKEGF
jgi:hypothetical protein